MKKYLVFLSTGVVAGAFGIALGFRAQSFFRRDPLSADIASAIETHSLISKLNQGALQDAKRLLNLKLDTSIMIIYSSWGHMDEANRVSATRLFQDVAGSRNAYPPDFSETPEEVREAVSQILQKFAKSR